MGVASVSDKARTEADAGGPIHRDAGRKSFSETAQFFYFPLIKDGSGNGAFYSPMTHGGGE